MVCVVCMEALGPAGGTCRLGCGHVFHTLCIQMWLAKVESCPTCRGTEVGCEHGTLVDHGKDVVAEVCAALKKQVTCLKEENVFVGDQLAALQLHVAEMSHDLSIGAIDPVVAMVMANIVRQMSEEEEEEVRT